MGRKFIYDAPKGIGRFEIEMEYIGNATSREVLGFDSLGDENDNYNVVSVHHNGRSFDFPFWTSIARPVVDDNEHDVISAFVCYAQEATTYINDELRDVANPDWGFYEMQRFIAACKKEYENLRDIGLSDDDIFDISNDDRYC